MLHSLSKTGILLYLHTPSLSGIKCSALVVLTSPSIGSRDRQYRQQRPTVSVAETDSIGSRDRKYRQQRPTVSVAETDSIGSRDRQYRQQRPTVSLAETDTQRHALKNFFKFGRNVSAAQKDSSVFGCRVCSYYASGNQCIHNNTSLGRKIIWQFVANLFCNQKKAWMMHILTDDPAFVSRQALFVLL